MSNPAVIFVINGLFERQCGNNQTPCGNNQFECGNNQIPCDNSNIYKAENKKHLRRFQFFLSCFYSNLARLEW